MNSTVSLSGSAEIFITNGYVWQFILGNFYRLQLVLAITITEPQLQLLSNMAKTKDPSRASWTFPVWPFSTWIFVCFFYFWQKLSRLLNDFRSFTFTNEDSHFLFAAIVVAALKPSCLWSGPKRKNLNPNSDYNYSESQRRCWRSSEGGCFLSENSVQCL